MAIAGTGVWEVRTGGSDSNGGYFNPARGNSDYSQAFAPFTTQADLTTNGTITVTSAGGNFWVASDANPSLAGNSIKIAGAVYEIITNASAGTMTVDRAVPAGATAGKIGGACASPGYVVGQAVNLNTIWIKSGTYGIGTGTVNTSGKGASIANGIGLCIRGYYAVRGDECMNGGVYSPPVLQCSAAAMQILSYALSAQFNLARNLVFDGNSQTNTQALGYFNAGGARFERCGFINLTAGIITGQPNLAELEFVKCYAVNCSGSPWNVSARFVLCDAIGCGIGFEVSVGGSLDYCIAYNSSGVGMQSDRGLRPLIARNCISVGNGGAGFNYGTGETAGNSASYLENCIAYGNGGAGFAGFATPFAELINCAGGRNTGGNYPAGISGSVSGFQSLANTDANGPFMSVATGDFRLNPAYTDYAKLKALSDPAPWPNLPLSVGYGDRGAVQHQDAGGIIPVNMNGGIRG